MLRSLAGVDDEARDDEEDIDARSSRIRRPCGEDSAAGKLQQMEGDDHQGRDASKLLDRDKCFQVRPRPAPRRPTYAGEAGPRGDQTMGGGPARMSRLPA
jgi:hypothetical protein